MENVTLLILFNHKYERNLNKLRQMYSPRFKNIYFIMPFYKGDEADVISVYENSYYFQGYLAQALKIVKQKGFQHYIVIGDDLILNPDINETNYKSYFRLDADTGFIPAIFALHNKDRPLLRRTQLWHWNYHAINFNASKPGLEVETELPLYEDALALIREHGIDFTPYLDKNQVVSTKPYLNKIGKQSLKTKVASVINWAAVSTKLSLKKNRRLKYPMVGSYSDIVIIPNCGIDSFAHYCGVFAALELFVEIAIPTALLLSLKKVRQEKDLEYQGKTLWEKREFYTMEAKYQGDINQLFGNFPENTLYIHPIKLSKWKV